jgi:hypothetical protein
VAEQRGQKFSPSPNATDGFFPNEQGLAAADALEREAIHRYNNGNGINYGYWQRDGDSGQWLTMPAANPNFGDVNFVSKVFGTSPNCRP